MVDITSAWTSRTRVQKVVHSEADKGGILDTYTTYQPLDLISRINLRSKSLCLTLTSSAATRSLFNRRIHSFRSSRSLILSGMRSLTSSLGIFTRLVGRTKVVNKWMTTTATTTTTTFTNHPHTSCSPNSQSTRSFSISSSKTFPPSSGNYTTHTVSRMPLRYITQQEAQKVITLNVGVRLVVTANFMPTTTSSRSTKSSCQSKELTLSTK